MWYPWGQLHHYTTCWLQSSDLLKCSFFVLYASHLKYNSHKEKWDLKFHDDRLGKQKMVVDCVWIQCSTAVIGFPQPSNLLAEHRLFKQQPLPTQHKSSQATNKWAQILAVNFCWCKCTSWARAHSTQRIDGRPEYTIVIRAHTYIQWRSISLMGHIISPKCS